MSEKIFLTGITGFIGSVLAKELLNYKQYEIHAIVRHRAAEDSASKIQLIDGIHYHTCNLTDYVGLTGLIQSIQPNYIFHIGAISPVRFSFSSPIEYQEVDYLSTVYLIHSALKLPNFKKFLFASTMETYGWQPIKKPFTEDLSLNPASPYAVAKVASEKYLHMAHKAYNLPFIALKPCNTYGRLGNSDFITEYLITQMLQDQKPMIGSPDAVRDLMYVSDHVSAYLAALSSPLTDGTFNFGWGSELTMEDLAFKIADLIGYKNGFEKSFPSDYPFRPIVEDYLSLNSSKAEKELHWKPQVSLDDGLKKTISYWKSKLS